MTDYLSEACHLLVKITYAILYGTNTLNSNYLSSNGVRWPTFTLKLLDFQPKGYIIILIGTLFWFLGVLQSVLKGKIIVAFFFLVMLICSLHDTVELHNIGLNNDVIHLVCCHVSALWEYAA